MSRKQPLAVFFLFIFISVLLFWQFFIKGLYLFPGNYLIAWFEPYKAENYINGNILIPHKPVADDVFRHIYPFKTLAVDNLRHFELPLWNPYNGSGMPLLATVNSGLIDPFNVLFLMMPYLPAWNIYLLLQFTLIGFFTFLYCRSIHFSFLSALFSSIIFTVSGVVVARVSLGAYGIGIAMLPLLLFVLEKFIANVKTKFLFLIPVAIFCLATTTHPQISFYVLLFASLYFLTRILALKITNRIRIGLVLRYAAFVILGLLLSAIQIFPTAELLYYSNFSSETSEYVSKFLVPFYYLVSIPFSNFFGNGATYNFWGQSDYIETVSAIGLIPCFFAYLFIFYEKTKNIYKKIFITVVAITLLLVVDTPISRFILSLPLPLISTDPPSRILLFTVFSLSILAGGGFEWMIKNKLSLIKKIKISLPFLFGVAAIIAGVVVLFFNFQCDPALKIACYKVALRNTILETIIFLAAFLVFILSSFRKNEKIQRISSFLIIFVVFLIGFYNAEKYFPFSARTNIFPKSELFEALTNLPNKGRIFGLGEANIATNLATHFRFYDPEYYHPLYIRRYGELTAYANSGEYGKDVLRSDAEIQNALSLTSRDLQRRERLLSLLNVEYLLYSKKEKPLENKDNVIWENSFWYMQKSSVIIPRIILVNKVQIIQNDEKLLTTLFNKEFDPSKQVILEKDIQFVSDKSLKGNATLTEYGDNKMTFKANCSDACIAVLLDNYYPGWNAYVDGKKASVYRADYTFRAIVLPEGAHTVEFVYEPLSVFYGSIISLIAGAILLLLYLLSFLRVNNNRYSN